MAGALIPVRWGMLSAPQARLFSWSCAEASLSAWRVPVPVWPAHRRRVLAKPPLPKGLRLLFALALGREEEAEGLQR